jgi:hypothetical protein
MDELAAHGDAENHLRRREFHLKKLHEFLHFSPKA